MNIAGFFSGNLSRKTLLWVVIPLIGIFFFGSLVLTVALFPQVYDWRTMSISQLLYPRVNPRFHFIPATGIAVTGLLLMPFAGYIKHRLGVNSPLVRAGAAFFAGGAICLTLCSLISSHPANGRAAVPELHEVLARVAGIGLSLGILLFELYALRHRRREGDDLFIRRLVFWWGWITVPAILMLVLRIIIQFHFRALDSFTRTLKHSALWHLGFWEWIGAAAVIVFLIVSVWLLPEKER